MKISICVMIVCAPALAAADDRPFVQGVVGYSSPIAGQEYMTGIHGGARVGVRAGWTPLLAGNAHLGLELGADWRAIDATYGEHVQQVRVLGGPQAIFAAGAHEVFFRMALGWDYLGYNEHNANGYAVEPGFGARLRHDNLMFGAEVAVPITLHPGGDSMAGFAGADLEVMLSVGSRL